MKETEGKFRGDLGKATGDTREHVKDRAELVVEGHAEAVDAANRRGSSGS